MRDRWIKGERERSTMRERERMEEIKLERKTVWERMNERERGNMAKKIQS